MQKSNVYNTSMSDVNDISTTMALNVGLEMPVANCLTRPRVYTTFSMLNSVEHEILNAHTYKNIKKLGFF